MENRVYNAFGQLPKHIAPSTPIRYIHEVVVSCILTFILFLPSSMFFLYKIPGIQNRWWELDCWNTLILTIHYLSLGTIFTKSVIEFWDGVNSPFEVLWRMGVAMALTLYATYFVGVRASIPRTRKHHVDGPQLLQGKQALREVERRSLTRREALQDPLSLAIHPSWIRSKKEWARHVFISGGVGSGKTVILLQIIEQILDKNLKCMIYDVKGDFTSKFRKPIIISPFDKRTWVWDIARDISSKPLAAAFAESLCQSNEGQTTNKYFTDNARSIITGCLIALQNEKGINWSFSDLYSKVILPTEKMHELMCKYYPIAANSISDKNSTATSGVMSTVTTSAKVISSLATAWPERIEARTFSIKEWIKDDYKGPKQFIVQAGVDPELTATYISAMVNVSAICINTPLLTDNESGRFIGFILDELGSLGKIKVDELMSRGRSKGAVVISGVQDLLQLHDIYGENIAKSMTSMSGTMIMCKVQMSDTRDKLANMVGKKNVIWSNHDKNSNVHNDSAEVIHPYQLTDLLGFRKGKEMGLERWGIKAIVQTEGDLLLLNFPGKTFKTVRRGQVPAEWTIGFSEIKRDTVSDTKDTLTVNRVLNQEQIETLIHF